MVTAQFTKKQIKGRFQAHARTFRHEPLGNSGWNVCCDTKFHKCPVMAIDMSKRGTVRMEFPKVEDTGCAFETRF